jgi:AraC family transcriptional regulator
MDWQKRMENAIAWMESHLMDGSDIEGAAREANCSAFHFMRMFDVVTGISPAEYVRRRRLTLAAAELSAGEAKVIDVALKYGYDSPDSFARAFRREFDCNPSDARVPGTGLHSYPPLSFTIALKGDKAMEYRIEKKRAYKLTGLMIRQNCSDGTNWIDIPAFWDTTMANGSCDKLRIKAGRSELGVVGVCYDHEAKSGDFSYAIAIETPEDRTGLPAGCVDIEVPESTWAIFTSRGPLAENFQNVIKRIFSEWFPSSGREHAGTAELEFYNAHPDPKASDYKCEYWVPLK